MYICSSITTNQAADIHSKVDGLRGNTLLNNWFQYTRQFELGCLPYTRNLHAMCSICMHKLTYICTHWRTPVHPAVLIYTLYTGVQYAYWHTLLQINVHLYTTSLLKRMVTDTHTHTGTCWHTVVHFEKHMRTLAYTCTLWHTQTHNDIHMYTMRCTCAHRHTLTY